MVIEQLLKEWINERHNAAELSVPARSSKAIASEIEAVFADQLARAKSEVAEASQALLEKVGEALQSSDLESFHFLVEGHTDALGSDEYNERLSIARAQAVAQYLEGRGIPEARLRPTGKGESAPVASNANEEGRQRNRRVDFVNLGQNP